MTCPLSFFVDMKGLCLLYEHLIMSMTKKYDQV